MTSCKNFSLFEKPVQTVLEGYEYHSKCAGGLHGFGLGRSDSMKLHKPEQISVWLLVNRCCSASGRPQSYPNGKATIWTWVADVRQ